MAFRFWAFRKFVFPDENPEPLELSDTTGLPETTALSGTTAPEPVIPDAEEELGHS